MNYKTGDKVRFLNEKREGTVSKIINKTTVSVTIEDDFEVPVLISELLLVEDNAVERVVSKTVVPTIERVEKPVFREDNLKQDGIYIAFSPEKENDIEHSNLNVWFINHTAYKIMFTFSVLKNQKTLTLEAGETESYTTVLIETFEKKHIEQLANFKVDVLFFDTKEHSYQYPVSEIIKFKIVKLYKERAFEENCFIDEKAYFINISLIDDLSESEKDGLIKGDLNQLLLQKKTTSASNVNSKPNAVNNPALEMEIDLHIHELLDRYSHLSNHEIVQVQLKHFQNALDKAINERYRKLIVIHGVGKLRLKQEVLNLISSYDNVKAHDASYSKYGFGATEIVISH